MIRLPYLKLSIVAILLITMSCSGPKPMYTYEKEKDVVPAQVQFNNASEDAIEYMWDFGDGNTSDEESPKHRYLLSGKYTVTLVAKKDGKEKKIEKDIIMAPPEICLIEMETTAGTMMIQLSDETPAHRDNFIKLAEEGYYNNHLFHRIIEGFMIQGGDPNSVDAPPGKRLGTGGPGYTVEAEFVEELIHLKGALAAARQGDNVNPEKRSSGSQFYIVHGNKISASQLSQFSSRTGKVYTDEQIKKYGEIGGTPMLDNGYTVYGQVIAGLEVVDKIASMQKDRADRPVEDVKILRVTVIK